MDSYSSLQSNLQSAMPADYSINSPVSGSFSQGSPSLPDVRGQQYLYQQLGTLFPQPFQFKEQQNLVRQMLGITPKQAGDVTAALAQELGTQGLLYGQGGAFKKSAEEQMIEKQLKQMAILDPGALLEYYAR